MIKLYNTLTRKLQDFEPIKKGEVGIYSCGPTVYDYAHLGHARTYTFADLLRKTLLFLGFKVTQVMNITDVGHLTKADISDEGEDKIEIAAKEEKKTVWEIAEFYTDDFFKMLDDLNILRPSIVCKATDHIQEQIEFIKKIEKKGFSYKIQRGVCFNTSKFPQYADFAKLDLKGIKKGARIEFDTQKRNPADFWLWRINNPKEEKQMEWDSPWGKGVPGWHIECSAMSVKYLGEHFDIHTGGIDHIPVHHTNEIAQNWAATGHKVVNFWIHGAFLVVEGEKMSKSLKNFYRVNDIKKRNFNPLALRYLFLTAHYRSKLNFTWKALEGAQISYDKLVSLIKNWQSGGGRKVIGVDDPSKIEKFRQDFIDKISNDLNFPEALAVVWQMAKSDIPSTDKLDLITSFDQVLGLDLLKQAETKIIIPEAIKNLAQQREKLRKEVKWKEADEIRKEIEKFNFRVEDSEKGTVIKKV